MSPGCQVLEAPDLTAALCVAVWPKPGTLARSFQSQDGRTRPKVSGTRWPLARCRRWGCGRPGARTAGRLWALLSPRVSRRWSLPMRCPGTGPAPRTSPRRRSCGHTAIGSASGATKLDKLAVPDRPTDQPRRGDHGGQRRRGRPRGRPGCGLTGGDRRGGPGRADRPADQPGGGVAPGRPAPGHRPRLWCCMPASGPARCCGSTPGPTARPRFVWPESPTPSPWEPTRSGSRTAIVAPSSGSTPDRYGHGHPAGRLGPVRPGGRRPVAVDRRLPRRHGDPAAGSRVAR